MPRARIFLLFSLVSLVPLFAQHSTPKHILGVAAPLTSPSSRAARDIGRDYLGAISTELGLSATDIAGVYLAKEYQSAHNGVTHLIYKQRYRGVDVMNAEWVVNVDSEGQILNAGGNLYSGPGATTVLPSSSRALTAVRSAARAVSPRLGAAYVPFESASAPASARTNAIRFARGVFAEDIEGELVWYAGAGSLRPAWLFYITDVDGVNRYATVIDDESQAVLARRQLTLFQSVPPPPRGLVFERESPQPNPAPGVRLSAAPPMVPRTLQSFSGDPVASPRGWTAGTETVGNNAVVGENLAGTLFLKNPATTTSPNGDFSFPLQLGVGAPNPINFRDAANTNLFYWMNRAHDLHYQSGFDEAAGNFQQDNFGRGGVGGDPIYAYSHFGAATLGRGQLENAFFTLRSLEDGSPSMVAMFLSTALGAAGDFFTDGSYDSLVMVHEYTHGVSFRLVRQGYDTHQGSSMGEAWSDFFGLEYTLPDGAPPDGVYPPGEYFDQSWGVGGLRTRPYSTNMDVNPLTYASLGRVIRFPEVHADGEIWFEALWEMRANLIKQFGEKEGRRRVRLLVIDGMKLSIPAPSMVDMRDAILLADRTDFKGASQDQIWAAFAKRGLGALAYADTGDTVHVIASTELPSTTGALRFYDAPLVIGEPVRIVLQDSNYTRASVPVQLTGSSGDVETLVLHKTGSIYVGSIPTSGNVVTPNNGTLNLVPGDAISAYYVDENAGGSSKLIQQTVSANPPYSLSSTPQYFSFGTERALGLFGTSQRVDLPFDFPFFSKKYSSVYVHQNGLLSFDLPYLSVCTDTAALAGITAIAPLWTQLSTTGVAQAREDVYMSETASSATFRWAAETFTPFGPTASQPVNFAATLFSDGRIAFQYGTGNVDIRSALTPSGCGPGPTVGISNGHDGFTQTAIASGFTNLATLHYDPPFNYFSDPVAVIESPTPGQHFQGVMQVTGVAYDPAVSVSRVDVFIDGVERARLAANVARRDFCAGKNIPACPNIGFTVALDVNALGLKLGAHALRVRVTNSRGSYQDFPDAPIAFFLDEGQSRLPFGKIESPADGETVSGRVTIKGYAGDDDLRVTAVDTLIDGITFGPTVYNQPRTDICSRFAVPPPNCPNIGFTLTLPTVEGNPPVPDGPHTLQIRVRDETGRYTVIPDSPITINVSNGPAVPVIGVLSSPANNAHVSGVIHVSGYAYSPGRRITGGTLRVDGQSYGTVHLGEDRTAECAALPDANACPNIGFGIDFDTTRVGNGPHVLGITLTNDRGDSIVIPRVDNGGINVFVEN